MEKIAFIYCANDRQLLDESKFYVNNLIVPEGYSIEIIEKFDQQSMAQGYNSAMKETDAKYKVYLHQDVFILNKFFIQDILDIFNSESSIGMIGMAGYENIAADGIMWHGKGFVSAVYDGKSECFDINRKYYDFEVNGAKAVSQIDGLLMATSYDVAWDEDCIKGFDFYDAVHSINMLRSGYKIVVPVAEKPWVLHDDNKPINMSNYEKSRRRYVGEYKHYLGMNLEQVWAIESLIGAVNDGRCEDAKAIISNSVAYLEQEPIFWILYSSLFEALGEYEKMYLGLMCGLKVNVNDYELLYMMGNYYVYKQDYVNAKEFLRRAKQTMENEILWTGSESSNDLRMIEDAIQQCEELQNNV